MEITRNGQWYVPYFSHEIHLLKASLMWTTLQYTKRDSSGMTLTLAQKNHCMFTVITLPLHIFHLITPTTPPTPTPPLSLLLTFSLSYHYYCFKDRKIPAETAFGEITKDTTT